MREQILKARQCSRSEVLNKRKRVGNNSRFVFNITYHPVLSKLKNVLSEIHLLLTPDREHGKVFENIPIVGFRRAKSLKNILVRAKVAPVEKKKGSCRSCGGTRCEICKHVVTTETFRSFSTKKEYCIKPNNVPNNTQVVLKVSVLGLTITSQPIGITLKGIPSNKR